MTTVVDERRERIEGLLERIKGGDDGAKEALYELVYDDLRRVAAGLMARERAAHTLHPTALVHQAYLKLFVGKPLAIPDRAYFFAAQARAMRQVLVDHARRRRADKRPDHRPRTTIDHVLGAFEATQKIALLDMDTALQELAGISERQYEVVRLRFFGRLRWGEIATYLGTSVSTVEKDWQAARAWLYGRLREAT